MEFPYELSESQVQFVEKAKAEGFRIRFDYSGRGMFGRQCPAVYLDQDEIGSFGCKGAKRDDLGKGEVIYMPY